MINLPLKWYVGSYPLYMDLVRKHLRGTLLLRPWLRGRAERAIFVIFNYDLQAVSDAFFYDYLQSIGLDLAAIAVSDVEEDLSEHYDEFKTAVRGTLEETARTGRNLSELGAQLNEAASQTGLATQQIAATIGQVAQGAQEQAQAATDTSRGCVRIDRRHRLGPSLGRPNDRQRRFAPRSPSRHWRARSAKSRTRPPRWRASRRRPRKPPASAPTRSARPSKG